MYSIDGKIVYSQADPNISNVPMQLALQTEAWQCGVSNFEQCANASTPKEVDMDIAWIVIYQKD